MTPAELRRQAADLRAKSLKITALSEAEDREVNADEQAQLADFRGRAESLERRAVLVEQLEGDVASTRESAGRTSGPLMPHSDPANARHAYSLLKAIRQMSGKNERLDGVELETSQEIARRSGKNPQGFYMPLDLVSTEARDLTTSTGSGAKPTITASTFIELLRRKMLLRKLGARVLTGMTGDFSIPKQTGGGTAYWVTEGVAPTESNQTIGQVLYQPKTVGTFSDISRKFLLQSSIDAEAFVRDDIAQVLALGIDAAGFNGSGSGAEPTGLLQDSDVTTVALGTDGGAPTWAKLVACETAVAVANADVDAMNFVTTPAGRGKLKTTVKDSNTAAVYLWNDDNQVNGYAAHATNQLPANLTKGSGTALSGALFGNFADFIIAMWGGVDVLVDPYTGSTAGTVRIVVLQDCDMKARHDESFVRILDMITA